jgi:hypothetical protein
MIVCLSIREFVSKPMYEDFKTKYTRISRLYMRTLIYYLVSNEASVLEHNAPTYFSVYSIELELHVGSVCTAHLCCGLTRIDLSFLENIRSNWVVIIG